VTRHNSNAKPQGELYQTLKRSKRELPTAAETGHVMKPETVASMIASGRITREVCCDGKKRYRTFEYADTELRPILEKRYGKKYEVYPCCYCGGFHMATLNELVA
jgi:hypothetical protein